MRIHLGVACLALLSLSGCAGPWKLGAPEYASDAWTIRLADLGEADVGCGGGSGERLSDVRETNLNISIRRDDLTCARLEAGRLSLTPQSFKIVFDGPPHTTVDFELRKGTHTDGFYGETPTSWTIAFEPGQKMFLQVVSQAPAAGAFAFNMTWTRVPDGQAEP